MAQPPAKLPPYEGVGSKIRELVMKAFYAVRGLPVVVSFIGGSLLLASATTDAHEVKAISPTNIVVRAEPAAPIRVILPSLWEEKTVARGAEAAATDRSQRQ